MRIEVKPRACAEVDAETRALSAWGAEGGQQEAMAHRERALQLLLERICTIGTPLPPLQLLHGHGSLFRSRQPLLRGGQLRLLVVEVDYQGAILLLKLAQLRLSLHL